MSRATRASTAAPVASLEQEKLLAVRKFNAKPESGIAYLLERSVVPNSPEAVAEFLRRTSGLSKRRIGDYLGEPSEFASAVLSCYTSLFDFAGRPFVVAVREYLSPFRLPGEAQKIDRIMCVFSSHYCATNPDVFANADAAYVLAFAIIMLNTDAHSKQIKRKMTLGEFLSNNRGINAGGDLPESLLTSVYHDITHCEIEMSAPAPAPAPATLDRDPDRDPDPNPGLSRHHPLRDQDRHRLRRPRRVRADGVAAARLDLRQVRAQPRRRRQEPLVPAVDPQRGGRPLLPQPRAQVEAEKCVPLDEIVDVLPGPASEAFKRHGVAPSSAEGKCCFSLVLAGRTLDLRAPPRTSSPCGSPTSDRSSSIAWI